MIGFVVFYVVPTIRGVYLSFTEYSILGDPEWVGMDNYTAIAKDPLFWNALAVTGQYVLINIVLQTALALGLALLMHRVAKSTLIRGALLLPYLMSNVIAALLWFWMLDYQIGIVNQFIELARAAPRRVLRQRGVGHPHPGPDQHLAPHGLHRAADLRRPAGHPRPRLRGGRTGRRLTVPDLPQASPCRCCARSWSLVLVVTVIGSFQVFDTVAVTTQRRPGQRHPRHPVLHLPAAFTESDFGYGSALAVILFLILALVAFIQMKFLKGNESDLD